MNLILALAVAVLIGSGCYLLLKHDLIRVVVGVLLISNGANLFIMVAGLERGAAPIYPIADVEGVADPLVQAMTLTAIVITFSVSALLLSLIYRVYIAHETVDTDTLAAVEEREDRLNEASDGADEPEDDEVVLASEGRAA
jgi:multicomponent Na+:H+ antiporter subunit C